MSRTRKDEPYFVKARKKGSVSHDYSCLDYTPTRVRTDVTTQIFFANEVKQMEAIEAELAETGGTFTVEERSGYLVTRTGEVNSFRYRTLRNSTREITPQRLSVDSVPRHPNFYSQITLYGFTAHVPHTVSDFDVFYIYTVTRTSKSGRNWGPRGQQSSDECCTPSLPWRLIGCGRSCCGDWGPEDPRRKMNENLKASAKIFNNGGLDAFDDTVHSDDDFPEEFSNLVYTSETPVSV